MGIDGLILHITFCYLVLASLDMRGIGNTKIDTANACSCMHVLHSTRTESGTKGAELRRLAQMMLKTREHSAGILGQHRGVG
jgi:hypothetical protein